MSIGTISSLGIGSSVLNSDLIGKLKENDQELLIDPIKNNIDNIQQKEQSLNQFQTNLSLLKNEVMDFSNGDIINKRNTNLIGNSISIDVQDGVDIQDFNINVKQLAQNDIYQSKGYDSQESIINNTGNTQTLNLSYNGQSFDIDIDNGDTLNDLKNKINDLNSNITASIIDTGNDYKLILKGNETGKDNIIKLDYNNIDDLGFNNITYSSNEYNSEDDKINDSGENQVFKISINDIEYSMNVEDGTTVKDFINNINNGELKDSNGNSLNGISAVYNNNQINFNLQDIGDITINDTGLNSDFNNNTNFENDNRLQKAENSLFDYNGVEIERTTNELKNDLIVGTDIKLLNTGETSVSIYQDKNQIIDSLNKFVSDYNNVISNLQDLTNFDKDNNTKGLFNGDNNFSKIESDLYNSIFSDNKAVDLGLSYDKNGYISFDSTKLNEDNINNIIDIFDNLNNSLNNITNNLDLYDNQLKNEENNYNDRLKSMNDYINTKYDTMTQQFISYDSIINQYNSQANIIQSIIEQQLNSK